MYFLQIRLLNGDADVPGGAFHRYHVGGLV